MKSLFRYYGGKFHQLKDIISILEPQKEKFDVVVDVFGGSGKVLLNIPDEWKKLKVYNDLNRELYTTFKVLQDTNRRKKLERKLRLAFAHEEIFQELKRTSPKDEVATAFKVLYLHTNSFMGDGRSFARRYQGNRISRYTIENFVYVKDWTVENMDFRQLMKTYNKPKVLFYLDPPYLSSGKKYQHSFRISDLEDLKASIDMVQGSYLLNLSSFDEGMEKIFGAPDKVIDYSNSLVDGGSKKWGCGFWWKI